MKRKKTVRRKSAPIRRRRKITGLSGSVRRRTTRRRKSMLSGGMQDALGLILGGVVTGLVDQPLSGIGPLSDAKLRSAVKTALGYFLMSKAGIVGGIGKGMLAVSGMQLAQSLMPGTMGELVPSLIAENIDVPSLIAQEMDNMSGYTSDEIAGYTSDELAEDEIGDEFGEDDDDDDDDDDDMLNSDVFGADVFGV